MDLLIGEKQNDGTYKFSDGVNDIHFDEHGKLATVSDTDLLAQNIVKIIKTEVDQNTLIPSYGSNISKIVFQSDINTSTNINATIINALSNLRLLYDNSSNAKEKPNFLQNLCIFYDKAEPTNYTVYFEVISDANTASAVAVSL